MQLTTNFKLEEFACHDGTPVPKKYHANVKLLAQNLQVLRDTIKEPIRINSGYRTPEYNNEIGGESNSKHMIAQAADITIQNKSPRQVYNIIERLISEKKMRQGGLGLYRGFVHYDVRGNKQRWRG